MKIEIAQMRSDPGRISKNKEQIIERLQIARQRGVNLVITPEMAVPGYLSLDLMKRREFLSANSHAVQEIQNWTEGISAIVGFVDYDETKIGTDGQPVRYNSAAILSNQRLVGIVHKSLLPDYDVFSENRYFQPAQERNIYEIEGVKIGVEICEDLWDQTYQTKVSDELVAMGAELLINISASPFEVNKRQRRESLLRSVVEKHQIPFIYVNAVGGQDNSEGEVVFDGQSLVLNKNGELLGVAKIFSEDRLVFDYPFRNRKHNVFSDLPALEQLRKALVFGIGEYFRRTGFIKAYIGLSGGIDSALVAALAVEALGKSNVTGIGMPSEYSSQGSIDDAAQLAKNLDIDFRLLPISPIMKRFDSTLAGDFKGIPTDVTEENIQARIRGVLLMAEANKFNGLVISTGNKTEMALGYSTLYGDMCGGLAAIGDVSKLSVYELARWINKSANQEIIPVNTIDKAPSAELRPGQEDESSLGAEYKIISPLVDDYIERDLPRSELIRIYPSEIVDVLIQRIHRNEFKRRQAPPVIKVTSKAWLGRRIPIAHDFCE